MGIRVGYKINSNKATLTGLKPKTTKKSYKGSRKGLKKSKFFAFIIALGLVGYGMNAAVETKKYEKQIKDSDFGCFITAYQDSANAYKGLVIENEKKFNGNIDYYVAASYTINDQGIITAVFGGDGPVATVKAIKDQKKQAAALINNFDNYQRDKKTNSAVQRSTGTNEILSKVMNSTELTEKFIADSINLSKKHGFDKIYLDMESLKDSKIGSKYSQFIKKVSDELHKNNIKLGVCVPIKSDKINNPAYDYNLTPKYADDMVIMAYDEHWGDSSEAGPLISKETFKDVADYVVNTVNKEDRDKVVIALPNYGRTWSWYTNGKKESILKGKSISAQYMKNYIEKHGVKYDSDGNSYIEFSGTEKNRPYEQKIYFVDNKMASVLHNILKERDLRRISIWALGLNDKDFLFTDTLMSKFDNNSSDGLELAIRIANYVKEKTAKQITMVKNQIALNK